MLGLKARTAPTISQQTEPTPDLPETPLPAAAYHEEPIPAGSTVGWNKHLCFHLDQSGIQMSAGMQRGKQSRLIDARKMYVPSGADTDQARDSFVTKSIGEYIQRFGARGADITVTVTGTETAFRVFMMPELKPTELRSAVSFEAKKQIPFPLHDCIFDFRPVYRVKNNERAGVKVALHAATRRTISERLAPFGKLGIQVGRIYHAHDIIGQLLKSLPDYSDTQHYTLINVERNRTEISYYKGSNLEFYHTCSIGSSFLARRSDPTMFEYFAESLAGEIQNSLDFYTGQYSGQFSTRICIYGDLAYTDELIDLLHDRFGYEFKRFPTEDLTISVAGGRQQLESLSVCLPVLAAATCPARLANLLPVEQKNRIVQKAQNRWMVTGLIALLGLLLATWVSARMQVATLENRLKGLTVQTENFKSSSLFDTYAVLKQEVVSGQSFLEKIKPVPVYLSLNLKELSNLTPQAITLFNLNYLATDPTRNLGLDGTVRSAGIPPEVVLAEYVETLQASPFFEDVVVDRFTKRTGDSGPQLDFHISMKATI